MTLILVYLLIGCIAARWRIVDIGCESTLNGDRITTAARWVLTWPAWIGRR